jgi:hypothetical protein
MISIINAQRECKGLHHGELYAHLSSDVSSAVIACTDTDIPFSINRVLAFVSGAISLMYGECSDRPRGRQYLSYSRDDLVHYMTHAGDSVLAQKRDRECQHAPNNDSYELGQERQRPDQ